MDISSDAAHQILLERHAERNALEVCRSVTFAQCLKDYGIVPTMTVTTSKSACITVRAIDIYALRKRFFEHVNLEQIEYPLCTVGEQTVDLCEQWLLNEHTERYRLLVSPTHQEWLRRVLTLVVVRHIMEQKYERSTKEGRQVFADPWVYSEMGRLSILHSLPGQFAQLVHHIVKDPEQAQEIIDQLYTNTDVRMKAHLFVSPEALLPLPQGMHLLLMLAEEKGQHDE